jgi:hypothetical protein
MIQNFKQYNESLTDKMTPKSDEDVKRGIKNYVKDVNDKLQAMEEEDGLPEEYITIFEILNTIQKLKGISAIEAMGYIDGDDELDNYIYQYLEDNITYDPEIHKDVIRSAIEKLEKEYND